MNGWWCYSGQLSFSFLQIQPYQMPQWGHVPDSCLCCWRGLSIPGNQHESMSPAHPYTNHRICNYLLSWAKLERYTVFGTLSPLPASTASMICGGSREGPSYFVGPLVGLLRVVANCSQTLTVKNTLFAAEAAETTHSKVIWGARMGLMLLWRPLSMWVKGQLAKVTPFVCFAHRRYS